MTTKKLDPLSVEEPSPVGEKEEERGAKWNTECQVPVKVFKAHRDAVTAAQFCFNNRCLLSCSSDCSAVLWDMESCQPIRTFNGVHSRTVSEFTLIPNSNR
ncbi:lissencephaly-1 homolog [Kryptolebias marmoratus]|uniref:lissencephaly-1 homolog n=1 Tax=Kryptolebias marmoratus TaxID=37003 RepID=UPI0018ACA92A|nr:lissencephaly-1 homolog [Kryptolebias marmoratus]